MGTQQWEWGGSQRKWVFVWNKAQIGTPNMPRGRVHRSILALSLYTHIHTHTHAQTQLDAVLLLRSHRENRELGSAMHILNRNMRERETSGSVGIDFCSTTGDNSRYKKGITGLKTTSLSTEKHKHRYS